MPAFSNFLEVQTRTPWSQMLAKFADFYSPAPSARTLDLGCGPGPLPAILARRGCIALGINPDMELLKANLSDRLCQGDASQLPFPDEGSDLVTAANVLFLSEDPVAALREWRRILKRGEALCLLSPSELLNAGSAVTVVESRRLEGAARESLLGWARNAESHAHWTDAQTSELLGAAGLERVESSLKVGPGFARLSRARKPK